MVTYRLIISLWLLENKQWRKNVRDFYYIHIKKANALS